MACYGNILYGPTIDAVGPFDNVNNVLLPPTGKPQILCRTIYADDGVTPAYYSYELNVDAIIYPPVSALADIETEVHRIRRILNTPGLKLKVYPVGLGEIPTINTTGGVLDLTGGPRPSDVSVEPVVTNEAIHVSWKVSFDISHCSPYVPRDMVQFNSEFDIMIDDEGNVKFTVLATYQSRFPITDISILDPLSKNLVKTANKVFQGMKRQQRISLSRDQRTAHFQVEYSEIPSDSAFHAHTRNVEVTDMMESSAIPSDNMYKGSGFYSWNRRISGRIMLPARVHKIWAYYVFRNILRERLKGMTALTKLPGLTATDPATTQKGAPVLTERSKASWLLLDMRMTNEVYTREFSFEMEYLVTCDLISLLSGKANLFSQVRTNMIQHVDGLPKITIVDPEQVGYTPAKLSDEWFLWEESTDHSINGNYEYGISGPAVYAQCITSPGDASVLPDPATASPLLDDAVDDPNPDPVADEESPNAAPKTEVSASINKTVGDYSREAHSWVRFDNELEFIQDNNAVQVDYLAQTAKSYYQDADNAYVPVPSTTGFKIGHHNVDPDTSITKPEVFTFGPNKYLIRMKGFAIRAGYKIPMPGLISLNGVAVTRVGRARYKHKTLSQSSNTGSDGTPKPLNVYLAMWDVLYAVEGPMINTTDILNSIVSSGDPGIYT